MIYFDNRQNMPRDISILAGYSLHKNYTILSQKEDLSTPRIRVIVADMQKIFKNEIGVMHKYDVVTDSLTPTIYLSTRLYKAIQQSKTEAVRHKVHSEYWQQISYDISDFLKHIDRNCFSGELLRISENEIDTTKTELRTKIFADDKDKGIYSRMTELLKIYHMNADEKLKKYLCSFPVNNTYIIGSIGNRIVTLYNQTYNGYMELIIYETWQIEFYIYTRVPRKRYPVMEYVFLS